MNEDDLQEPPPPHPNPPIELMQTFVRHRGGLGSLSGPARRLKLGASQPHGLAVACKAFRTFAGV